MEARAAANVIGGRYRISGLLGTGGMAQVFEAFDDRLQRPVALKILRPETKSLPGMRTRFQQEARIAARLVHPHIVAVLDFGDDGSTSYLVMERLPGVTLRDEIACGPLAPARARLVLHETLAALGAAHARGVLHRDIKPSNILLQGNGHTKITDFGIAKSFDIRSGAELARDDMTMTGVVLGTPGYLAPERRAGGPATVQSDLYSVGAVMVEALTGGRAVPGTAAADALPEPFRAVASRAMATDPRDRFASAGAMARALRASVAAPRPVGPGPGTAVLPAPPGVAPRDRRRRRRRLEVAASLLVAALVATAWLVVADRPHTGPAPSASSPRAALTRASQPDAEGATIRALAAALAHGGLPGDRALAHALDATAALPPGPSRQAAAAQALSLAQVLLSGGGITSGQDQDVASVLQPTGVTTTTTTSTSLPTIVPMPAQAPSPPGSLFGGHGHGHRGGPGDQG